MTNNTPQTGGLTLVVVGPVLIVCGLIDAVLAFAKSADVVNGVVGIVMVAVGVVLLVVGLRRRSAR